MMMKTADDSIEVRLKFAGFSGQLAWTIGYELSLGDRGVADVQLESVYKQEIAAAMVDRRGQSVEMVCGGTAVFEGGSLDRRTLDVSAVLTFLGHQAALGHELTWRGLAVTAFECDEDSFEARHRFDMAYVQAYVARASEAQAAQEMTRLALPKVFWAGERVARAGGIVLRAP